MFEKELGHTSIFLVLFPGCVRQIKRDTNIEKERDTQLYVQYYFSFVREGHNIGKNWDTNLFIFNFILWNFVRSFYLKYFKYFNLVMSQTVRKKPKVFRDGFKYVVHKVNVTGTIQYWRCQQFRSCHGRAISEVGSFDIRPTQPHNHPPVEEVRSFQTLKLLRIRILNIFSRIIELK